MADQTVLNLITGSLQRVEDSIGRLSAEMRIELAKLPDTYLGRREGDRRFDEMIVRIGGETSARQSSIRDVESSVEKLETRLTEGRRWAIGMVCVTGLSATAVVVNIVGQLT